jgi:hypothetical protein
MVSVDGLLWLLQAVLGRCICCRALPLVAAVVGSRGLDLATQCPDEAVHKKITQNDIMLHNVGFVFT